MKNNILRVLSLITLFGAAISLLTAIQNNCIAQQQPEYVTESDSAEASDVSREIEKFLNSFINFPAATQADKNNLDKYTYAIYWVCAKYPNKSQTAQNKYNEACGQLSADMQLIQERAKQQAVYDWNRWIQLPAGSKPIANYYNREDYMYDRGVDDSTEELAK